MDLKSLDERSLARSIVEEVKRINSRPIELSVVKNKRSTLEANIKYKASLREVATSEEACELEVELARLKGQLIKVDAELAARAELGKVAPVSAPQESAVPDLSQTKGQARVAKYRSRLMGVLEKRRRNGESQTRLLIDWITESKLARTSVTDYLGCRIQGRVSGAKCMEIEAKIDASVEELGLNLQNNSD